MLVHVVVNETIYIHIRRDGMLSVTNVNQGGAGDALYMVVLTENQGSMPYNKPKINQKR